MIFFNISAFFYAYFSIVGVYVMFMPKVMQLVGYTPMQIGFIFAMPPLIRFLIPFLFLKHIDLNKKVFHMALIFMIFGALLFYPTIDNFWLFIIPNIIIGATMGLVLPYIETFALERLKKEGFGRSRLYGSIGFMLIGIVLAKMLNDPMMGVHFFVMCIILTVIFGFSTSILAHNHVKKQEKEEDTQAEPFIIKKMLFVWVSLFFMQVSFGPFYNFFTIYETAHGVSLSMTSYLWAFGVICEIVFFYFQAPLLKYPLMNLLKISIAVTVVRWFLLYAYAGDLAITFFSQSLHAISFALNHTVAISLLHVAYKNRGLATQFYYGFSFGLGGFVGALLAGLFYGPYLYLYAAGMALISFIVLFFQSTELKQNL